MNWEIDYLEEDQIVEARTSGRLRWEDNKLLSEQMLEAGREHRTNRFLVDHQELQPGFSVLEADKLPGMLRDIGVDPQDKIAVLFSPGLLKDDLFSFLQNVAYLNSLQLKVFTDRDEAIDWLTREY